MNIVIPPVNIKLGEYTSILKFVDDIGDEREEVLVLDHEQVQLTVVLHWMEFTILLLNKEEGRSEGRNRGSNITTSGHIIEEGIESGLFHRTKGINLTIVFRDSLGFKIYSVIPFMKWGKFVRRRFFKDLSVFEILFQDHLFQGFDVFLRMFHSGQLGRLRGAVKRDIRVIGGREGNKNFIIRGER